MNRSIAWGGMVVLAAFGLPRLATAAESATAHVTYLAGGSVYVDAGTREGIVAGDSLAVVREAARIAGLRVQFVSSHRAVCDTFAVRGEIQVGDAVRYVPRTGHGATADPGSTAGPEAPAPGTVTLTPAPAPADTIAPTGGVGVNTQRSRVRGRLGARLLTINSAATSGRLSQPGADARLDALNIAGGRLDVVIDARGLHTSNSAVAGRSSQETIARAYRLSAALHDRHGRRRLTAGRQSSPSLSSISLFDGVLLEQAGARWSAGLFAGTQPRPVDLGFSTRIQEQGGYFEWRGAPGGLRRWSATTGFVVSREAGTVNRDFLFVQAVLADPRWSAFMTQELDVNTGWKRDAGEAAVSPTSTFLSASLRIDQRLTLRGGFDSRRNARLYRDRLTPEAEFDDRYRRGAWAGASYIITRLVRVEGDGRFSDLPGDRAHTLSAGAHLGPFTRFHASLRGRGSVFQGESSRSELIALGLGVDPTAASHVEVSGGVRTTDDLLVNASARAPWTSVDLDVHLLQAWYAFGSYEVDHADGDMNQSYVGLSWRF